MEYTGYKDQTWIDDLYWWIYYDDMEYEAERQRKLEEEEMEECNTNTEKKSR